MSIHLIVTESEQQAIVNALAFYNDWHATDLPSDTESKEQWLMSFREDNGGRAWNGPIDQLATKIATSKWSLSITTALSWTPKEYPLSFVKKWKKKHLLLLKEAVVQSPLLYMKTNETFMTI